MTKQLTTGDMLALPVEDRLRLIEALWDSLDEAATESLPIPDWHKAAVDERLAAHAREPSAAAPWDEVKANILGRLRT